MTLSALSWTAFALFVAGLGFVVSRWFIPSFMGIPSEYGTIARLAAVLRGCTGVLAPTKLFILFKTLVVDIICLRPLFQAGRLRWATHQLIFFGFVLLTLFHALAALVTRHIFPDYQSTLNPFFAGREILGILVLAGVILAVYRRFIHKERLLVSNGRDIFALALVAVIILSGIALEGMKMASQRVFMDMVEEYAAIDTHGDTSDLEALKAYWAREFALVPHTPVTMPDEALAQGKTFHEEYCASCHAPNTSAFAGYATARIMAPLAPILDRMGMVTVLWYVHILSCLFGLATLPFTKFLHILTTPLSLMARALTGPKSHPAAVAVRQAMAPQACTHCGVCSQHCSALVAARVLDNLLILPGEKMDYLRRLSPLKAPSPRRRKQLAEGVFVCTSCERCFRVCPSGIDLATLWMDMRTHLLKHADAPLSILSPLAYAPALEENPELKQSLRMGADRCLDRVRDNFDEITDPETPLLLQEHEDPDAVRLSRNKTFSYCFVCQNCTTVCPVVASYEHPQKELGMLPHQIMCSLGLGLTEMCSKSAMIWKCTTCYQCQEHCPQDVRIVDLFYRLKHAAVRNTDADREPERIKLD
jgi:heterodisulfide reductase subunit C/nitrate reductase gamma subunit